MIKIDLKPSQRKLRQFGWIGLFGFALIGTLLAYRMKVFEGSGDLFAPMILWGLAVYCPISALIFPKLLLPIYFILSLIAIPIGFVISNAILIFIYFLMITPLSLYFRMVGRDELQIGKKASKIKSHWIKCSFTKDLKSYYRQF